MKKLTAGIFATILGVTAMGAADAAVTSKGYVDAAVGAVAQSVTDLGTNVARDYATKQALETAEDTLQQNINAVAEVANAAAPQVTTYTKEEVDAKIAGVDGATAIAGLQNQIDAINLEQTTQNTNITNLQNNKANSADVYTKTEADAAFATAAQGATADATAATVATYGDIVTHDVAEFATAAQGALAATAVQPAAINDMATMTWVEGKDYATNTALTTGLSGKQATLSDTQLQAVNSGITADKISAMDQATADVRADAKQALAGAENAQTAANAANAALNTESKLSDGQYTLTMKVVEGVTTYGWELIDRYYAADDVTGNGQ